MGGTSGVGIIPFRPLYGGVAQSGMYTVRVKAAASRPRVHPYGNALDDFRNGDPLVLEVAMVDREGSVESTGSITTERSVGLAELTSEQPGVVRVDHAHRSGLRAGGPLP